LPLEEALRKAQEARLDLIEISPTANPPVAKITERGKYFYEQEKKERQAKKKRKEVEIKSIRLGIGTGTHDLELKAKQVDKFLKDGNKIKIDLALRGREKYLKKEFLEERIKRLLSLISGQFSQESIQRAPKGLSVNISPK
jgi:translation initiation factor IF-3